MSKDIFSKKSRFSIRKLNIGVCSVLLGTLIMMGHTAKADEMTSDTATVTTVSTSQGDSASTTGSSVTVPESVVTTTAAPAVAETVAATSVNPTSSVASSAAVSSEAPASASITSSKPNSTEVSSTSPVVSEEATTSTSAKTATASETSRSATASTASSTTASSENATENTATVSETANAPRVRSRRALSTTRSTNSGIAVRASEGSQTLDYTNKEDVEGYVKISYEVDNANNVVHWTVLDNPGRKGNSASGYVYFTVPKDSVGAPTNWKVVQTDKNGKVVDTRNYWKDNDGSYLMGQNGRMDTYTGAEMTKRLTELFRGIGNPAIKRNEAAVAAQTAERSQALYTMTADNNKIRNVMWTITFDTPILDKSQPFDFVAGMKGTGLIGGQTNIMTGYTDNFMEDIKFQAVAVQDKYTAKVGGSFNADPSTYVTNQTGTPAFPNNYRGATTFAWKDGQAPTATTPGTYTKTVVVTYPEYYKQAPQEVTITFEVQDPRSDADKNDPTAKAQTVTPGTTPNAQDSIGNVADLPSGTTFDFKTPVDTATDGEKDATVVVTYPDGSKDEVPVKVTVKTPSTDADNNTPVAKAHTVTPGTTPNAQDSIGNVADLPSGTTFEFKTPVDTATEGEKDATVVVTYPDGSKDEVPVKVTVKTPVTPNQPTITTDLTGKAGTKTPVEVTAESGSKVELFDKDGNKIGEATADNNGKATITPTVEIPAGNVIAKVTDPAGNTSDASDPMVATTGADTEAPAKPVVNPVKAGDTAITGTAEAGSTVEVTLPDGSKVSAKADQDGNFSVPVSGLKEGDTVSVTATDDAGNTSNPTSVTVGKGTDTTAPSAPVVNPVKAGATAVTGTAEAGSTVEVTLPDGSKVSAKADQAGNFSVPVSGLKEGAAVSVTATDDAGNTSNPTSVTVGKGIDTTAPDAPVVNTDLTGKAGTRTPIDVIAEPGSKVELFDKDGNKIGEVTADETGHAVVVPTVNIPEGIVTAKATDLAGNVSGASAPMLATTSGTVDSFNNGKGSENTPTVVKPSLSGKVEPSTTSAKRMNLKTRANISAIEKDASTLPATGDEASIGGVVLGGILAAAGLAIAGKRRKED